MTDDENARNEIYDRWLPLNRQGHAELSARSIGKPINADRFSPGGIVI